MKRIPTLATINTCTGCLACADVCPHGAIKIVQKWNLLYPIINEDICVKCDLCSKTCPIVSPLSKSFDIHKSKVVAAWCNVDSIRMNAASGGFCTAMSLDMIHKGGKVALCVWKKNKANFILTDNESEILQAANSKYVQSDASGIYKQVQKALSLGTSVLFIGHPCQVGGLKSFLRNKEYDNLTTIEFICSAPPSPEAIEIQESVANGSLLKFRCKNSQYCWQNDYNIVIKNEEGCKLYNKNEGLFYPIFATLLTARYACMNCPYAKLNRYSDYIVGDFHGYRIEGWEKGINLVICNTSEAYNKIKKVSNLSFEDSTLKRALSSNTRLFTGWDGVRYHPANIFRSRFNSISPKLRLRIIVNKYPFRFLWLFFKVMTKINIYNKRRRIFKEF